MSHREEQYCQQCCIHETFNKEARYVSLHL